MIFGKSKEQLERDNSFLTSQNESLRLVAAGAQDDLREAKFQLSRRDADHDMEVKEAELEHELELGNLTADHKSEMAAIKSETAAEIADNDEAHTIELRAAERRISELENDIDSAIEAGTRELTQRNALLENDMDGQVELAVSKKIAELEKNAKATEAARDAELKAAKKALKDEFEQKFATLTKQNASFAEAADYNRGTVDGLKQTISVLNKQMDFISTFATENLKAALGKLADVSFNVENPAPVVMVSGGAATVNKGGDQSKGGNEQAKK